jgi:hypothetical protein
MNHELTRNDTKQNEQLPCLLSVVSCEFVVTVFVRDEQCNRA